MVVKHSSALVPPKMAPLTPVPRHVPLSLEPEGAPSTSVASHHTDTVSVLTMLEVFEAARNLLALLVTILLAVQESTLLVPVHTGEPAESLQHSEP